MSAGSKKVKITADLIGRCLHSLDELNLDYVVLIDGIPASFSNCKPLHAAAIVEESYMLSNKRQEYRIESRAEKMEAIPQDNDESGLAQT